MDLLHLHEAAEQGLCGLLDSAYKSWSRRERRYEKSMDCACIMQHETDIETV